MQTYNLREENCTHVFQSKAPTNAEEEEDEKEEVEGEKVMFSVALRVRQ